MNEWNDWNEWVEWKTAEWMSDVGIYHTSSILLTFTPGSGWADPVCDMNVLTQQAVYDICECMSAWNEWVELLRGYGNAICLPVVYTNVLIYLPLYHHSFILDKLPDVFCSGLLAMGLTPSNVIMESVQFPSNRMFWQFHGHYASICSFTSYFSLNSYVHLISAWTWNINNVVQTAKWELCLHCSSTYVDIFALHLKNTLFL